MGKIEKKPSKDLVRMGKKKIKFKPSAAANDHNLHIKSALPHPGLLEGGRRTDHSKSVRKKKGNKKASPFTLTTGDPAR